MIIHIITAYYAYYVMYCYINWCNLLGHSHEPYESLLEDEKENVKGANLFYKSEN